MQAWNRLGRRGRLIAGGSLLVVALGAGSLLALSVLSATADAQKPAAALAAGPAVERHLLVDQFGYRPGDAKVVVLRDPKVGYDANDHYEPAPLIELRRVGSDEVVAKEGSLPWNDGKTQASSGDRGWWVDFSKVREPGRYTVYDPVNQRRSAPFTIGEHVYRDVLKAATRMYYYQRSSYAKKAPYAEACWADAPAYVGKNQDTEARDVTDPDNKAKVRDVSGGWFDAGDTNKYVTYAASPVNQLLTAWERTPKAFTDDTNIPESGNGVPDVLDEVKWELDWLKRMQFDDGSVALKVGVVDIVEVYPPSADRLPRYYIPPCTSSTIATAGMFAHAAASFATVPQLAKEAEDLKARAIRAWNHYQSAPKLQTDCDSTKIKAGDADWDEANQRQHAVAAAAWLFIVTGEPAYEDFLRKHYRDTRPYRDIGWSRYEPEVGDALLAYATQPRGDAELRATLLADKRRDAETANDVYRFDPAADLYRAFLTEGQYHWGSSQPRGNSASSNADVVALGLGGDKAASYAQRALEALHYFHGVNPFGHVYLSNMRQYGATSSLNSIYHAWFWPGSKWSDVRTSACGPAPGYVAGGPNASAVANGVPASLQPPSNQPPQKSYRDWNGKWPESSWAITEPGIYFQSAYIRALAPFAE